MLNEEDLRGMGFEKQGEILCRDGGHLVFKGGLSARNKQAGVYLWLCRIDETLLDEKYAGKAGYGLDARMGQHVAGLRTAPAERVEQIKQSFGVGNCLEVWFRESVMWGFESIFKKYPGATCSVSAYSTEEEALITHFDPPLNRAKTPAMRALNGIKAKQIARSKGFTTLDLKMTDANGEQRDLWTNAVHLLTDSHKKKIGKVHDLVINFLQQPSLEDLEIKWPLDYRVIGRYIPHEIPNQTLLVLGKFVNKKFRSGSRVVYISLENELISFSPKITKVMQKGPDQGEAYSLDACIKMLSN
jgi:hypothetical protein